MVSQVHKDNESMLFTMVDNGKDSQRPRREVVYNASTYEAKCSCKMFELEGIPCRHILVLKAESLNELPPPLVANRWIKVATEKPVFDADVMLLEGCAKETSKSRLVSSIWTHFNDIMHVVEQSEEDLQCLLDKCISMKKQFKLKAKQVPTKLQELESFVGCIPPEEVDIHPPKPSCTKGSEK